MFSNTCFGKYDVAMMTRNLFDVFVSFFESHLVVLSWFTIVYVYLLFASVLVSRLIYASVYASRLASTTAATQCCGTARFI